MFRRGILIPVIGIVALVLIVGGIAVLRFRQEAASTAPPAALLGHPWKLVAMTYDGQAQTLVPNTTITITFQNGANGQVFNGSGGCNAYGGKFVTANGHLTLGEMSMTAMACLDQRIMTQELYYTRTLEHANLFTVDASALTLRDGAGNYVLRYVATTGA